DTLRRYDADLDAAFEQACATGDLAQLLDTVRPWWFEADTWRDPRRPTRIPGTRQPLPHRWPATGNPAGQPHSDPRAVRHLTPCTGGNWTNPQIASSQT
ncbi:MAG TPA: DUF6247 family protein, partial [Streptosporangiaceae bacterium]